MSCTIGGHTFLKQLKWYKSLSESKFRYEEGCFLIEGRKAINQVFLRTPQSIVEILTSEEQQDFERRYNVPCRVISEHQLHRISSVKTSQGIIAVVKIPDKTYLNELPDIIGKKILLLENLQDPGNVGTLIRTAAAFNYSGVIMSSQCADPFSSKVVQATSGSLFSIWIRKSDSYLDLIKKLKIKGFKIFAADVRGEPHVDFSIAPNHVIALGSEGSGLTQKLLDQVDICFSIPIEFTNAESLNVAISGGIVMFSGMLGKGW